jgi:hypothetical protein
LAVFTDGVRLYLGVDRRIGVGRGATAIPASEPRNKTPAVAITLRRLPITRSLLVGRDDPATLAQR